jgi:hypothetical protein
LVALTGLLLTGLTSEWLSPAGSPRMSLPRHDTISRHWAHVPGPHHEAFLAVVLARPLFAQSRRPAMQAAAADPVHAAAFPRLTGIVLFPGYRRAVFEDSARHSMTAAVETVIDGWRIVRIDPNMVSIDSGDRLERLSPSLLPPQLVAPSRPDRWVNPAATGVLHARWSNPQLQP